MQRKNLPIVTVNCTLTLKKKTLLHIELSCDKYLATLGIFMLTGLNNGHSCWLHSAEEVLGPQNNVWKMYFWSSLPIIVVHSLTAAL